MGSVFFLPLQCFCRFATKVGTIRLPHCGNRERPDLQRSARRPEAFRPAQLLDQNETSMAPLPELVEKPTKATANKAGIAGIGAGAKGR